MKLPVALALVIGLIGAILTYLYVGPLAGLGLFIPATFIGAGSYFAAGGDTPALRSSLLTNIWGIICATIALILVGLVASPLLVGLIVGVIISIIQTVTSIQDNILAFIPRAAAIFVVFAFTFPWMLRVTTGFAAALFRRLPELVR